MLDDPFGGPGLGPEVPARSPGSQRGGPRPDHLDPGDQVLDRLDHRLERPGVARRVV